jgi:PIN domain nuclease of toxin-antitoxin system
VRYLIDTHILLWWLENSPRLSAEVRRTIANPQAVVFVSAASVWEMSIKQGLGKLSVPEDLLEMLNVHRFQVLDVTAVHGLEVAKLPNYHKDPFDRMLIAQARFEGLTLVSGASKFEGYEVRWLRA